ncbi:MAG: glycosyltransferase family 2 protein [Promethearchaeota archaeon]
MDRNLINSTTCDENIINDNRIPISFNDLETQEPYQPYISIIIPVYNEEKNIKSVLERIPNHQKYEIIVVDDGSTDNSIKKILELSNKKMKIIRHKRNIGYGAALLTGFKNAKGKIIVTMDSDGQHNPEEIDNLIKPILENKADMTIGSRYKGICCNFKVPFYTRLGELCIKIMLWILYKKNISNNQNGFRAYNLSSLKIVKKVKNIGMGFSTEVLFNIAREGLRILEIPITANKRKYGESYANPFKVLKSAIICILKHTLMCLKIKLYKYLESLY